MKKEEKSFFSFKFEEPAPKKRRRPKRLRAAVPSALTISQILQWADAHHARTGKWPNCTMLQVHENPNEKWRNIDMALRMGSRGLPRGSSLARLLIERRGARFSNCSPPLTEEQILQWADAHKHRTGAWPSQGSDAVAGAAGEVWRNIDMALRAGGRGLPGNSSIAQLLSAHRGTRNKKRLPPLTIKQILGWADAYKVDHGSWPTRDSGPVAGVAGEIWANVDEALYVGLRSLPGGSSLARLLAEHRGKRNIRDLPALTAKQILAWADEHLRRTGRWPSCNSGPIEAAPDESWAVIDSALTVGRRGLPGGSSLVRFLAEHRGHRNRKDLPSLTLKQILDWADAHFRRTGHWPTPDSGPVEDDPGEHWSAIEAALNVGSRGLSGGISLACLLAEKRGRRNVADLPSITVKLILTWADAHFRRTGRWPSVNSGPIEGAPGETWTAVAVALTQGRRGLPGGSSLARLLAEKRGRRNRLDPPKLTVKQILRWADAHFRRTGRWPIAISGPIAEAADENWAGIEGALIFGRRGLPGGSSLACLFAEQRGRRHNRHPPTLSVRQILDWADAHFRRTGRWPSAHSGPIDGGLGENWSAIESALNNGRRGLSGGSSLHRLLVKHGRKLATGSKD